MTDRASFYDCPAYSAAGNGSCILPGGHGGMHRWAFVDTPQARPHHGDPLVQERLEAEAVIDGHMPPSVVGRHRRRDLEAGVVDTGAPHGEAQLGYATTADLINELHARAHVAGMIGEVWPGYSTVGGQDEAAVASCEAAVDFGELGARCELDADHPDAWHRAGDLRWRA